MRASIVLFLSLMLVLPIQAQKPGAGLTALEARSEAPEFDLTDIDGNHHRLSNYHRSTKVFLLPLGSTSRPVFLTFIT